MWWLGCTGLWIKTENNTNIAMDYWCGSGKRSHYDDQGKRKMMDPDHQMARMSGARQLQPNLGPFQPFLIRLRLLKSMLFSLPTPIPIISTSILPPRF